MVNEGISMAIRTESYSIAATEGVQEELETLQAILASQGRSVSYEESVEVAYELLGFFEALGEENPQGEVSHA